MLTGKHILLGVTGGIAAYKSAVLVRECVRAGAEVQVVMTRSAAQFVTPLTFSTLSRREVIIDMFPGPGGQASGQWTAHIDLGMWADVMLIAPATANTLAKVASGIADNFLTTLVLALRCPLVVAPAMDVDMWLHEATQRNISVLRETGVRVIEPETGELASGLSGPGRLPEPAAIVGYLEKFLEGAHQDLRGKRVLVTAGPTHEPIDPVRYIANRSSGKQGFAIAAAAQAAGAEVILVSGPVDLDDPPGVTVKHVESARQMLEQVQAALPADIAIFAAAVADWRVANEGEQKLKKTAAGMPPLQLVENPDILATISKLTDKRPPLVIGFAAETEHLIENAKSKLARKGCDWIVANDVSPATGVMGGDRNTVHLLSRKDGAKDGEIAVDSWPVMTKEQVAIELVAHVARSVADKSREPAS